MGRALGAEPSSLQSHCLGLGGIVMGGSWRPLEEVVQLHTAQVLEPQPQGFRAQPLLPSTNLSECRALFCHQCELAKGIAHTVCQSRVLSPCISILLSHSPCTSPQSPILTPALHLVKTKALVSWPICLWPPHKIDCWWGGRGPFVLCQRRSLITQPCVHLGDGKRKRERLAVE